MKTAAYLFKMLSVDKRIEIIEPLCVTQSAASQHLRVLKSAGLVSDERRGYRIYYSLDREALESCRQRLNRLCSCGCQSGGPAGRK